MADNQKSDQLPDRTIEQKYEEILKAYAIALKERNDLKDELEDAEGELKYTKDELSKYVAINQQYQERVSRLERTVAAENYKQARLHFTALQGRVPILWIKAEKGTIDERQFNRLRNGISNCCPGVEMVLMTEGTVNLYELSDEDLNRMGLARIEGILPECPNPVPDVPRLEDQSEREEDRS